ncbi:MAG: AAA family ATPase [Myxococcota bacterium]
MEAVLFTGVQATGKSTFYRSRFFRTHVRVSLDQLRTRNRERKLVEFCLETGQPFVVDNTNPTRAERARYVGLCRDAGFRVEAYYFQSLIRDALARNRSRTGDERVPDAGVLGTYGRLELPAKAEGFDAMFYVRLRGADFEVEVWSDEARS